MFQPKSSYAVWRGLEETPRRPARADIHLADIHLGGPSAVASSVRDSRSSPTHNRRARSCKSWRRRGVPDLDTTCWRLQAEKSPAHQAVPGPPFHPVIPRESVPRSTSPIRHRITYHVAGTAETFAIVRSRWMFAADFLLSPSSGGFLGHRTGSLSRLCCCRCRYVRRYPRHCCAPAASRWPCRTRLGGRHTTLSVRGNMGQLTLPAAHPHVGQRHIQQAASTTMTMGTATMGRTTWMKKGTGRAPNFCRLSLDT